MSSNFSDFGFKAPDILLPSDRIDAKKWAVVACDQYTSQPEYWESLSEEIGDEPSTLRLIFPEVYLETGDKKAIISSINENMKKYLENGANVAIAGSRQESVDKALAKLPEYAGRVMGIWPDICSPEEVAAAFASVKEKFGSLDILANNAGISSRTSLYDYTIEEFSKIMDLNVKAVFVCTQAAARIMKAQGGGVIVNTSSMVGEYGQPSGCGYPASKFAVNGLTRSLARELAKDNIRVNAVAPGVTRTDMVAALPQELVDRISAGIPLGRVGEPLDIANAYLYLSSDLASYVTGVTLRVDGAAMT